VQQNQEGGLIKQSPLPADLPILFVGAGFLSDAEQVKANGAKASETSASTGGASLSTSVRVCGGDWGKGGRTDSNESKP